MGESKSSDMRFNDEVIGQIAKLVQLAILTGTDVVDNLRMMRVSFDGETETLVLSDEYRKLAEEQVEKLMEEVAAFQSEQG